MEFLPRLLGRWWSFKQQRRALWQFNITKLSLCLLLGTAEDTAVWTRWYSRCNRERLRDSCLTVVWRNPGLPQMEHRCAAGHLKLWNVANPHLARIQMEGFPRVSPGRNLSLTTNPGLMYCWLKIYTSQQDTLLTLRILWAAAKDSCLCRVLRPPSRGHKHWWSFVIKPSDAAEDHPLLLLLLVCINRTVVCWPDIQANKTYYWKSI